MSGFGADINALFQEVTALLYDCESSVVRKGAPTATGRFQYTTSETTVYTNVPTLVQHNAANYGSRAIAYADRLAGRALALAFVPREYVVLDRDTIKVEGGDTYEVVGPPHLDGPDDPNLTVPCAAIAPVVVNPAVP